MHPAVVDRRIVEDVELHWTGLQLLESHLDQQRVAFGIGDVGLSNSITSRLCGIHLPKAEYLGVGHFDLMSCVFRLPLYPTLAVGDDELQQTRIGLIYGGVIHLVERSLGTECEPHMRTERIRGADPLLIAARPVRHLSRCAGSKLCTESRKKENCQ